MQYLWSIWIKKCVVKLIFSMGINVKVFYKLILSFSMDLVRRFQITQKILQYLCNISRKKLGMKFIFSMCIDLLSIGIIPLICQLKTMTNDYFCLNNEGRDQESVSNALFCWLHLFTCSYSDIFILLLLLSLHCYYKKYNKKNDKKSEMNVTTISCSDATLYSKYRSCISQFQIP